MQPTPLLWCPLAEDRRPPHYLEILATLLAPGQRGPGLAREGTIADLRSEMPGTVDRAIANTSVIGHPGILAGEESGQVMTVAQATIGSITDRLQQKQATLAMYEDLLEHEALEQEEAVGRRKQEVLGLQRHGWGRPARPAARRHERRPARRQAGKQPRRPPACPASRPAERVAKSGRPPSGRRSPPLSSPTPVPAPARARSRSGCPPPGWRSPAPGAGAWGLVGMVAARDWSSPS